MKEQVRLGIIGLGGMGSTHARSILEGKVAHCRLAAICDSRAERLDAFDGVLKYSDSAELVESGEVDAVLVATPHFAHTTVGIQVLEQGLHLLTEKPISVHKADCERLLAAHRPGLVFAAMFDVRTEPRYQQVRKMIREGALGAIRRINWIVTDWFRSEAYYASAGWRATWSGEGGGMLVNQLPHDLDLFQWLFGMPRRVHGVCKMGKYHDIEVEDEVNAIFEYENGTTGVLVATTGEAPGTDRREIIGEMGRLLIYPDRLVFTRNEVGTTQHSRTTRETFAKPATQEVSLPIEGTATRHVGILNNFVESIRTGAPLIAPAQEGINSVELANAIIYSSYQGRAIDLPLDSAEFESFLQERMASSRGLAKASSVQDQVVNLSGSFP